MYLINWFKVFSHLVIILFLLFLCQEQLFSQIPATNYSGGSLFSATDLSSSNFTNIAKVTTLNVTGNSGLTGNLDIVDFVSQTGANTFSTGTGAISLNGATTVTGANTFPLVLEL